MKIIKMSQVRPQFLLPRWFDFVRRGSIVVTLGTLDAVVCKVILRLGNFLLVDEICFETQISYSPMATKLLIVKKAQSSKTKKVGIKNSKKHAK